MNNYDELVKRLREEYSWNARQICTSTQMQDTLLSEAADAIESLLRYENIKLREECNSRIGTIETLQARVKELESAMHRIINDSKDYSSNPNESATHMAMKAVGWTWIEGKAHPPEPPK